MKIARVQAPEWLKNWFFLLFQSQVFLYASSLAYSTLLTLVPLFALSLFAGSLLGSFEVHIRKLETAILNYLTFESASALADQLAEASDRLNSLNLGLVGYFLLLLMTAKLLYQVDVSFQEVWQIEVRWVSLRRIVKYFLLIIFLPLILALIFGVVLPLAMGTDSLAWSLLGHAILPLSLVLIFQMVPARKVQLWISFLCGIMTGVFLQLGQWFFVFMSKRFFYYDSVYGSLAALMLSLFWLWIFWSIILVGAALSASLHRHYADSHKSV